MREGKGNTIVTFNSEEEEEEWPDESDALSALIPIRTQLARGDLRSLYIGWLRGAQTGELGDEAIEPPVPPGLGELDGSLARLADFLRVDTDLLEVAAAASPPMASHRLTRKAIRKWVAGRPSAEKDDYLERLLVGEEPALAAELQHLIANPNAAVAASAQARTVEVLLRAAQDAGDERRRAAAVRAEIERKRREEEAALARSKYLEYLARRGPAVWSEIDELIATKQPASYDRAVGLLVDLRNVAAVHGGESNFPGRLEGLRTEHARKPSFLLKMQRAGLG